MFLLMFVTLIINVTIVLSEINVAHHEVEPTLATMPRRKLQIIPTKRSAFSRSFVTETSYKREIFVLDTQNPQESVRNFCPPTSNCRHGNGSGKVVAYTRPCCIACDCQPSCAARGTCCTEDNLNKEDAKSGNIIEGLAEECVSTYVGDKDTVQGIRKLDSYWLVNSCPDTDTATDENDTKEKCIRPDEKVLEEMTPVYSHSTMTNYRNKYCALCNNDINVVPWESFFLCDQYTKLIAMFPGDAKGVNHRTLQSIRTTKGCLVKWMPPLGKVRECIDQGIVISNCNNSLVFNRIIEEHCHNIYSPVKGEFGIYKNVFCLACNEGEYVRLCDWGGSSEIPIFGFSFTILLALDEGYTEHRDRTLTTSASICSGGRKYVSHLDACVRETCPISFLTAGDTCKPLTTNVGGVSFDYRIKLVYLYDGFQLPSHEELLANLKHLVLHDNHSSICDLQTLTVRSDGEYMVVRIQLTKTFKKPHLDFHNDLIMFHEKVRRMQNESFLENRIYTIGLGTSPFQPINDDHINYAVYSDYVSEACGTSIAVSNMQTCATILAENVTMKDNGVAVINNKSFLPGEYIPTVGDNTTMRNAIYICRKLYFARMATESVTQTKIWGASKSVRFKSGMYVLFTSLAIVLQAKY